jgi:O-acetyl-ADP-ribose deacetylase
MVFSGVAIECVQSDIVRQNDMEAIVNAANAQLLGPIYGVDEPADELLAACYRSALRLAEQQSIESVAFPALSTGAFGYPMEAAAQVALRTLAGEIPRLVTVRRIRFVLFHDQDCDVHVRVLQHLAES